MESGMNQDDFQTDPLSILLVEDNKDHAELVIRSFRDNNATSRFHHVQDGVEALDYLFRRGEYAAPESSPRPALILLDLRLPRIDGLEVLREIKADGGLRSIPVIILSSSEADQDIARAYAENANSYLVKPIGYEKFLAMVHSLCSYWLSWNRHPWE